MIVLGLDTCLNACSVAVLDGERVLAHASETMARGHQERLAPMAQAVMEAAGLPFASLERIGATVGPGSFTGLRVGVAFAKGLASALAIPAVGVGTLEALAAEATGLVAAAIDARRDQVYLQVFEAGEALMAPDVLPLGEAAARLAELAMNRPLTLVGSGAPLLAAVAPRAPVLTPEGCDARRVARLAAGRAAAPIRPLYLRAPDAKLPGGAAARMTVRPASAADLPAMASVHAQAFDAPWDEAVLAGFLSGGGAYAFVADEADAAGLVLCRAIAGEAEVLTLAVPPWARRRGLGRALMAAAIEAAVARGSGAMFLEVDVANAAAIGLYERLGFARAGLRKAYYNRGAQGRADALVMRLDLTSAPR